MNDLRPADSPLSRFVRAAAFGGAVALCVGLTPARGGAQGTDSTHAAPPVAPPASPSGTASGTAPGATAASDAAQPARDTSAVMTAADSAIQRAQALVAQGHTDQGRTLVDSIIGVTPPASPSYASALYARASLAANADSAEDDYRRITVEYATSPRASDALLRLAQLELARGDRAQAADHLARLTREQLPGQSGATSARTQLQVGLAYFDLQDMTHACAALAGARSAAPPTDVELRNRIDYNVQRCPRAGAEPATATSSASMSPPPAAATAAARDSARRAADRLARSKADSAAPHKTAAAATKRTKANSAAPDGAASVAPSTTPRATPATGAAAPPATTSAAPPAAAASAAPRSAPGFTVQVAAYPTRAAAESLAARLRERGYESRVSGTAAPFRVRVGHYATEAAADAVERALKAKGMDGFVTAAEAASP
jgi:cell division protein FtsN